MIRGTITVCCLVSREWNRIFTPVLYENIVLPSSKGSEYITYQSLLLRTFRHTQPSRKALVKAMTIAPAEDVSTANFLSICFSMPNLRKVTLEIQELDPATLHPDFAEHLHSLSRRCTIQMGRNPTAIKWNSLPSCINFIRRSKSLSSGFRVASSDGDGK